MNAPGAKGYDNNMYGDSTAEGEGYLDYIPDDKDMDAHDPLAARKNMKLAGITGQKALIEEMKMGGP